MLVFNLVAASTILLPAPGMPLNHRLYVDASAPPGGDGQSWATANDDLQDALAEALARLGQIEVNEIWVAAGTYVPTTNPGDPTATFRIVPRASLYGGFAGFENALEERDPIANPTILSGDVLGDDGPAFANQSDNVAHVLWAVGVDIDNATITDGFTITGGHSSSCCGLPPQGSGFYVYAAGPTIRNCVFLSNWSSWSGGGVHLEFGGNSQPPRVERCRFEGNFGLSWCGAMSVSNQSDAFADVVDCEFVSNSSQADTGALGGTYLNVIGCRFFGNSSRSAGGALFVAADGNVVDCVFLGNHTEDFGGAVYTIGDSFTGGLLGNRCQFANCLFYGNTTTRDGGAIYTLHSRGDGPTITNCTITGNTAGRDGGGLYLLDGQNDPNTWSRPFIRNCIVWGNVDPSGTGQLAQVFVADANTLPTLDACDVQGWDGSLPGVRSFSGDPRFQDPLGLDGIPGTEDDDYRLVFGSPCMNHGTNALVPLDFADQDDDGNRTEVLPLDLDGGPRIFRYRVDLGCFESRHVQQKSF